MLRTIIQFSALWLTLVSAIFLIRGSLVLSAKDIGELSATKFGYNLEVAKNLAQQKAGTKVGFCILLLAFTLQMINSLWPMRWVDFGISGRGIIISVIVSFLILGLGLYAAKVFKNKSLEEANIYLKQRGIQ